jgi:Rps23 Pro-64 3,4-dihydroxylase Tpa1-like proline 4-hydroxylase
MLNDAIDIAGARTRLQRDGRVQIPDYLQSQAATHLHCCLQHEVPWTLAIEDRSGARTIAHADYAAMGEQARVELYARVAMSARSPEVGDDGFRFAYDSYMMVEAYKAGRDPGLILHRVLEFFNTPEYLGFMRELTGEAGVRRINARASRYRPGQFLRRHSDINSIEGRMYAYVINLSKDWQADWGGLLQFIDDDGRVVETFLPRWNSLSLFRVPAGHAVSLVAPWADQDRLAITGWLLS